MNTPFFSRGSLRPLRFHMEVECMPERDLALSGDVSVLEAIGDVTCTCSKEDMLPIPLKMSHEKKKAIKKGQTPDICSDVSISEAIADVTCT